MKVAKEVLQEVGPQFDIAFTFTEALVGGAAIDATGDPLPDETLAMCQASDAVLLAAIGGYKWDSNPADKRPEQGLLRLRAGLGVFANLRPANILPQLIDASSLKREVVEGTDIMVVRELIGGIYFGKPKGFGTDEAGNRTGYNTMIYSEPEIERIARVGFETAQKRSGRLCSVKTTHSIPHPLYLAPSTLYPTPYTIHPKPYTQYPTPYTLHPTPYTLHPPPYTLHLKPYILNHKP